MHAFSVRSTGTFLLTKFLINYSTRTQTVPRWGGRGVCNPVRAASTGRKILALVIRCETPAKVLRDCFCNPARSAGKIFGVCSQKTGNNLRKKRWKLKPPPTFLEHFPREIFTNARSGGGGVILISLVHIFGDFCGQNAAIYTHFWNLIFSKKTK